MSAPKPELVDPESTVDLRQRVLRPHNSRDQVAATTQTPGVFAIAIVEDDRVLSCVLAQPETCPDRPEQSDA